MLGVYYSKAEVEVSMTLKDINAITLIWVNYAFMKVYCSDISTQFTHWTHRMINGANRTDHFHYVYRSSHCF